MNRMRNNTRHISTPTCARLRPAARRARRANGDTAYATDFTGAGNILDSAATLRVFDCQFNSQTAPCTFAVRADMVNDCVISTTPLSFGSRGRLAGSTRALGSLDVKCTAASSYRIASGSGLGSAAPATRKMRNLLRRLSGTMRYAPFLVP
jgi:spore coat protein U-like protein